MLFMMFFAVLGQPLLGAAASAPPLPGFGKAKLLPTPPFAEWPDAPSTMATVATRTTTVPSPVTTHTYSACGGLVATPRPCASGFVCMDDPWKPGCGMACDMPGICVEDIMCGGIAGRLCPDGKKCIFHTICDGGPDCSGTCV